MLELFDSSLRRPLRESLEPLNGRSGEVLVLSLDYGGFRVFTQQLRKGLVEGHMGYLHEQSANVYFR